MLTLSVSKEDQKSVRNSGARELGLFLRVRARIQRFFLRCSIFDNTLVVDLKKKNDLISTFLFREFQESKNSTSFVQAQVSLISLDILRFLIEPRGQRFGQLLEQRDCLGRRFCLLAQNGKKDQPASVMESVLLKLTR